MARTKRRAQSTDNRSKIKAKDVDIESADYRIPKKVRSGTSSEHEIDIPKRKSDTSNSSYNKNPKKSKDVVSEDIGDIPRRTSRSSSRSIDKIPKKIRLVGDTGGEKDRHTNRYARQLSAERLERESHRAASTSPSDGGNRYRNRDSDRYSNTRKDRYRSRSPAYYKHDNSNPGEDRCDKHQVARYGGAQVERNGYSGADRYSNTGGDRYGHREDNYDNRRSRRDHHHDRDYRPDNTEERGRGYDRGVMESNAGDHHRSKHTHHHQNTQQNSHRGGGSDQRKKAEINTELLGWAGRKAALNHDLDSACGLKLVVLDLNGLLVHRGKSTKNSIPNSGREIYDNNLKFVKTLQGKSQAVYVRPYVEEFIDFLFTHFHVAVWSSMMDQNVRSIMEVVFRPEDLERVYFLLHQGSCDVAKHPENKYKPLLMKNLHRVWKADEHFTQENTLLIDDSKLKARLNPSNLLFNPAEWVGDMKDNALSPDGGYIYDWMDGFSKWQGSVADYVKDQEQKAVDNQRLLHMDIGLEAIVQSKNTSEKHLTIAMDNVLELAHFK